MHSQKIGAIAQLVEQRTENPCVPSSILGGTTKKKRFHLKERWPSGRRRTLGKRVSSKRAPGVRIPSFPQKLRPLKIKQIFILFCYMLA